MPEQRHLISVIIPVYNVEKYLRECLDSVAGQTYDNLEIICIDDGSTDSSGVILDEYAAKDRRFKIIHQKNRGLSVARNKGLEIATGDYIGFVDSDDMIKQEFYQTLLETVISSGADVVQCGHIIWDKKLNKIKKQPSGIWVGFARILKELRRGYVWNKLWKAVVIQNSQLRFYPQIYIEDVLFSSQAACFITKLQTIDYVGYLYRQNPDSITKDKNKKAKIRESTCIVCQQALLFAREHQYNKRDIKALKNFLIKQLVTDKDCSNDEYYQRLKSILGSNIMLGIKRIKGLCKKYFNFH